MWEGWNDYVKELHLTTNIETIKQIEERSVETIYSTNRIMKLSSRIISSVRRRLHKDIIYKIGLTSSILSYCENKALIEQGIKMNDLPMYQYCNKLHELTNIRKLTDAGKIRVGRNGDGGYVMADVLSEEKIAYSIGIGGDVSWDRQMAEAGYDVYMYDHTIRKCPEENSRFHWKKIGIGGGVAKDQDIREHTQSEWPFEYAGHGIENGCGRRRMGCAGSASGGDTKKIRSNCYGIALAA